MATEDVYATLLLNDLYLPGALVLGHSLRDEATAYKLAVLVTNDSVSEGAIAELRQVYDYIIPVGRVVNRAPANLSLMDRVDLHSAFTKIELWKQTQFRRIIYMDADMVAWRAPDELFALEAPFSAAPDIGWPDLFNTGFMVLKPNMGDYWALHAMAQRGISFDGADQGLINMHFKNTYNRISFSYNVTPSAHYQYVPAYKHFQASISATHFIGKKKPWTEGRDASSGTGPYNEIAGRWWSTYDKHFRETSHPTVQRYVKGEEQIYTAQSRSENEAVDTSAETPISEIIEIAKEPGAISNAIAEPGYTSSTSSHSRPKEFSVPYSDWDAQRSAPPADSKPEAANFPSHQYTMSVDSKPFVAPERYPSPPRDMYYAVPKTPTYQKPAPIFPWEKNQSPPTRVFAADREAPKPSSPATPAAPEQRRSESAEEEQPAEIVTDSHSGSEDSADPWQNFSSTSRNAWDDIPEIERYIGALQKNRKGNIQIIQGYGRGIDPVSRPGGRRPSMRLTDFPTELERPSLPVTPAPIRRPSFWGEERDEAGDLPAAEGVPSQAEWDPVKQLEALARHQSSILGKDLVTGATREIPFRPLPYGSEGVKVNSPGKESPQITETSPLGTTSSLKEKRQTAARAIDSAVEQPSYAGPSAAWEKDETYPTQETPLGPSEAEQDALS